MEYTPSNNDLRLKTDAECALEITSEQELVLRKAHAFLGFHALSQGNVGFVSREDLGQVVLAATDLKMSDTQLDMLMSKWSKDKTLMSFDEFKRLMQSSELRPESKGRYWVALSLAEAETIRRILHVRHGATKEGAVKSLIDGCSTEVALRLSSVMGLNSLPAGDGGVVLDASNVWRKKGSAATPYEAAVAYNSFRFFDCDMYLPPAGLSVLVKSLGGRYSLYTVHIMVVLIIIDL